MTEKLQVRPPGPADLALAVRDALQLRAVVPFVVTALALAVIVNILTATVAMVAFAYVRALWERMLSDKPE